MKHSSLLIMLMASLLLPKSAPLIALQSGGQTSQTTIVFLLVLLST